MWLLIFCGIGTIKLLGYFLLTCAFFNHTKERLVFFNSFIDKFVTSTKKNILMGRFRRDKVKAFDAIGFHKEFKKIKILMKGELDYIKLSESSLGIKIPEGLKEDHHDFLTNLLAKYSG